MKRLAQYVLLVGLAALAHCGPPGNYDDSFDDGEEIGLRYVETMPDVDAKDRHGRTALVVASQRGMDRIVRKLLDLHASTDIRDPLGFTPLQDAARGGHDAVVRELAVSGADLNAHGGDADDTAIDEAVIQGRIGTVRLLLDLGADPNARDRWAATALHYLAQVSPLCGPDILALLNGSHADLNATDLKGWTPLHEAAAADNALLVRALIAAGVDAKTPALSGQTALDLALAKHADLAGDVLWRNGATPKSELHPLPPLFDAARLDQPSRIERLLANGADSSLRFEGKTALDVANESGSLSASRILAAASKHE